LLQFLYEPFYAAGDNANNPPHDERFIGYGYTRNTQVSKKIDIYQ
jgi:N-acetyllactosaminide beta-1,3-N-acetylglucosaminyltransferase